MNDGRTNFGQAPGKARVTAAQKPPTLRLAAGSVPPGGRGTPPSTSYMVDLSVMVGRMQPPGEHHRRGIAKSLQTGRRALLLLGSALQARSPKNPFRFAEVSAMVRVMFSEAENARLDIAPLPDCYNDAAWVNEVQQRVAETIAARGLNVNRPATIGFVGHRKDASSEWLGWFPGTVEIPVEPMHGVHASDFRTKWLQHGEAAIDDWARKEQLHPDVVQMLRDFTKTPAYEWLKNEHAPARDPRDGWLLEVNAAFKAWASSQQASPPIEESFDHFIASPAYLKLHSERPPIRERESVTADAVFFHAGHVMAVERAKRPGMGLLSMPGSYPRAHETTEQAVIRSLVEDFGLLVSVNRPKKKAAKLLEGLITHQEFFDHPGRSSQGRRYSMTYLFHLRDYDGELPEFKKAELGSAFWMPVSEIRMNSERWFEDHGHIISRMIQRIGRRH